MLFFFGGLERESGESPAESSEKDNSLFRSRSEKNDVLLNRLHDAEETRSGNYPSENRPGEERVFSGLVIVPDTK